MIQKPKFNAGMAFYKDDSLLFVFFFSRQIEVVLFLVVDQLSKPQHYPKNTVFYSVNHSVIG